jgi:hypothetical protein
MQAVAAAAAAAAANVAIAVQHVLREALYHSPVFQHHKACITSECGRGDH